MCLYSVLCFNNFRVYIKVVMVLKLKWKIMRKRTKRKRTKRRRTKRRRTGQHSFFYTVTSPFGYSFFNYIGFVLFLANAMEKTMFFGVE